MATDAQKTYALEQLLGLLSGEAIEMFRDQRFTMFGIAKTAEIAITDTERLKMFIKGVGAKVAAPTANISVTNLSADDRKRTTAIAAAEGHIGTESSIILSKDLHKVLETPHAIVAPAAYRDAVHQLTLGGHPADTSIWMLLRAVAPGTPVVTKKADSEAVADLANNALFEHVRHYVFKLACAFMAAAAIVTTKADWRSTYKQYLESCDSKKAALASMQRDQPKQPAKVVQPRRGYGEGRGRGARGKRARSESRSRSPPTRDRSRDRSRSRSRSPSRARPKSGKRCNTCGDSHEGDCGSRAPLPEWVQATLRGQGSGSARRTRRR